MLLLLLLLLLFTGTIRDAISSLSHREEKADREAELFVVANRMQLTLPPKPMTRRLMTMTC